MTKALSLRNCMFRFHTGKYIERKHDELPPVHVVRGVFISDVHVSPNSRRVSIALDDDIYIIWPGKAVNRILVA